MEGGGGGGGGTGWEAWWGGVGKGREVEVGR